MVVSLDFILRKKISTTPIGHLKDNYIIETSKNNITAQYFETQIYTNNSTTLMAHQFIPINNSILFSLSVYLLFFLITTFLLLAIIILVFCIRIYLWKSPLAVNSSRSNEVNNNNLTCMQNTTQNMDSLNKNFEYLSSTSEESKYFDAQSV